MAASSLPEWGFQGVGVVGVAGELHIKESQVFIHDVEALVAGRQLPASGHGGWQGGSGHCWRRQRGRVGTGGSSTCRARPRVQEHGYDRPMSSCRGFVYS